MGTFALVRGRYPTLGWLLFALFVIVNLSITLSKATAWGVDWRVPTGHSLTDFRDLVTVPGRWLLDGGNPYDPVPYLRAHPWAQEFDPYAPAWLWISLALGWMPIRIAAAIYLTIGAAVSALVARSVAFRAAPRHAAVLAPAVACWFQVWYPTRIFTSSFLCVCGLVLALCHLSRSTPRDERLAALGLAIACLKPQIGLPAALVLLAYGHWRMVTRGLVYLALGSLPPLVACTIAAGGPTEFILSIGRVVRHAMSPEAPTGLLATDSLRVDIPAMATRWQLADLTPLALVLAVLLFLLALLLVWRCRPEQDVLVVVLAAVTYLVPVHLTYDISLLLLAAPAAWALHRQRKSRATLLFAVISTLPIVHLHRISGWFGISGRMGDSIDAACVAITLAYGLVLTCRYNSSVAALPATAPASEK